MLARKYRPRNFAELIGQEAMVRTLTNAIAAGRLAHAFMLTGVRGVGKTTTARIIARALNCIGPDGKGGPTAEPCGVCDNCIAIAEDRHVDVIEMDAASRTGVDDIRELIEGVRYRPVERALQGLHHRRSAHALDQRLQRAAEDAGRAAGACEVHLRDHRDPQGAGHRAVALPALRPAPRRYRNAVTPTFPEDRRGRGRRRSRRARLALIARAADGSVRDGLSLLDQAIARAEGEIGEAEVRDMLGLADRSQLFDLFERLMRGDAKARARSARRACTPPAPIPSVVLQDLLELTHWLTRVKLVPQVGRCARRAGGRARARQRHGRKARRCPCWRAPGRCC